MCNIELKIIEKLLEILHAITMLVPWQLRIDLTILVNEN